MAKARNITIRFATGPLSTWQSSEKLTNRIKGHKNVERCTQGSIILNKDIESHELTQILELLYEYGFNSSDYTIIGLEETKTIKIEYIFFERLKSNSYYTDLDLGSDVAEHEKDLGKYFIRTSSYYDVLEGKKRVIVGPKGSGKSAIKQMIYDESPNNCILVTPEHYQTDILNEILDNKEDISSQEKAFSTAWKHTLLIEVFKRVLENKKGMRTGPIVPIHNYMRDNYKVVEMDLFSRFVSYIKRIQGIKIGKYELGYKTSELKKLYSLEELYNLLPSLKQLLKKPFYILIDELDQGWDNTVNSNDFIIGLFLAGNELNSYHPKLYCCSFIRGEIFDIVCRNFSHLDKLRYTTEELTWDSSSLLNVLCKRIAHSLDMPLHPHPRRITDELFAKKEIKRELGESPMEYILNRLAFRPRELIQMVRLCHNSSLELHSKIIDSSAIKAAEGIFSKWKNDHICAEYSQIYPGLRDLLKSFQFKNSVMIYDEIDIICIRFILNACDCGSPEWARNIEPENLIQILYNIGFIGFPNPNSQNFYGYSYSFEIPNIYVKDYNSFQIHPGFWKNLNIEK